MLNELREASLSLCNARIRMVDWHPKFKECPNYKCFRLYISTVGIVEGIEPVAAGDFKKIRKWEPNNGWSFPVINAPSLFSAKSESAKKMVRDIKKSLERATPVSIAEIDKAIKACDTIWDENARNKIENSLRIAKDVSDIMGPIPEKYGAISALLERTGYIGFGDFRSGIMKLATAGLSRGNVEYMDVLFQSPKNIQFILELEGWSKSGYEYPAVHSEVQKWMNMRFLEHDRKFLKNSVSFADAFGEDAAGSDEQKFPDVKIPVLGNVKLRSMFKDIPAQRRYGMIEAYSFPAGNKVRMAMKSALEWLSDRERKGKTWCDLSKRIDRPALLFAYPAQMPETAPELAGLLGGTEDVSVSSVAQFSAIAKRVIEALSGRVDKTAVEVRIFVLTKMDKARTKVLANRSYTAAHMIHAAVQWQKGCANIPETKIMQFGEEKEAVKWSEPLVPFPADVLQCLNTAWRRQGEYAESVHGHTIEDVLDLLLDSEDGAKRIAGRAVESVVRNAAPLLLAVRQANQSGKVFKTNLKYAKQPLILPAILGLLLYKLGNLKGGYMSSATFLVGRFLSLTDGLHMKYCMVVRKGSIPPQLIGNSLMSTALESPVTALSVLSQRILPYQAWANTLRQGEDVGLVKYFLGQLAEVSEKLGNLEIPKRCTDAEKAQLLLGYLARPEKTED